MSIPCRPTVPLALFLLALPCAAQRWEVLRDMAPAGGYGTTAVVLADADGDGDLDAVAKRSDGAFLYRNDGNGVFGEEPIPAEPHNRLDAGDVDGDGVPDLFLAGSPNRLLLGDGDGTFTPAAPGALPATPVYSTFVVLHDADADGDLDAFVSEGAYEVAVLLNDGTGTFAPGPQVPTFLFGEAVATVAPGDLDGDGDVDLYVANEGDYDYVLFASAGTYALAPQEDLPDWLDQSRDAALADVDGDGDLDVFVASGGGNRLLVNDGSARFVDADPLDFPPGVGFATAVEPFDADLDGDVDVVWAESGANGARLLLGDGAGAFVEAGWPDPEAPGSSLAAGDLDGDGDPDVLVGSVQADRVHLNDGAATFASEPPGVAPIPDGRSAALADLDGDGAVDAVVGTGSGLRVLGNDGAGFFGAVTHALAGEIGFVRSIEIGDLDGDGDLDVWAATTDFCEDLDDVLLGDGAGSLAVSPGAVPTPTVSFGAALADVDGDGDLDAATACSRQCVGDQDRNRLFLNDGAASFSDASDDLPENDDRSRDVVAADFDGDGDPDLLVGNGDPNQAAGPQPNRLYRNGGSGVFSDASSFLPGFADNTVSLAVGDVDDDGDLDALVGNDGFVAGTNVTRLLRNDGAGFVDASADLPSATTSTTRVLLNDLDEDGDLDAYLATDWVDDELWWNDGAGSFAPAAGVLPDDDNAAADVVAGDVDLDGDADLLFAGVERLWVGVARQVARRGMPRLGKPLGLEVFGPAGGAWVLLFSTGTAEIPLGAPGALLLDPLALLAAGGGALDGDGEALVSFPLTANPAFAGVDLWWQAAVGADLATLRLTNRERTTPTAF